LKEGTQLQLQTFLPDCVNLQPAPNCAHLPYMQQIKKSADCKQKSQNERKLRKQMFCYKKLEHSPKSLKSNYYLCANSAAISMPNIC
jgi:hypothetical protein